MAASKESFPEASIECKSNWDKKRKSLSIFQNVFNILWSAFYAGFAWAFFIMFMRASTSLLTKLGVQVELWSEIALTILTIAILVVMGVLASLKIEKFFKKKRLKLGARP